MLATANGYILPAIHTNGTSRDSLIEQHVNVLEALREAHAMMEGAAPNARDFYQRPIGELQTACEQHKARVERLRLLIVEYVEITEGINEQ